MLLEEIREDRKFFEKEVGYVVNGMSYAYRSYNKEVIEGLENISILYARTTKSHGNFGLPGNFLEWNPTMHHTGLPDGTTLKEKAEQFTKFESWRNKKPLFYLWEHSYEFNDNNNWEIIEEFCKMDFNLKRFYGLYITIIFEKLIVLTKSIRDEERILLILIQFSIVHLKRFPLHKGAFLSENVFY